MAICGLAEPGGPGLCVGELGHRGRHKFRPETEEAVRMESVTSPDGTEIAIAETTEDSPTEVRELEPDKAWTPDAGDFVSLKGKAYLPARRRIQWMRGLPVAHPEWTIDTEVVEHERGKLVKPGPVGVGRVEGGYAAIRANVFDQDGRLIATGLKSEYSENFTDYLEKAETGAIARALAVAGYGTESAIDLDEGVEAGRIADAPVEVSSRPVKLGPSSVEGVGRGGTTPNASVAQIRRVADLSRELSLGPSGLSSVIDNLFDVPLGALPGSDAEASVTIASYLSERSRAEVGKLIETLEAATVGTGVA